MALFEVELPNDLVSQFERLENSTNKMLAEMTRAGAEVVAQKAKAQAPKNLASYVKLSKSYLTPSDDGVNTKVYISGYIPFKPPRKTFSRRAGRRGAAYTTSKGIPAAFLANMYEYGRSTAPFPKRPFFRKAFNKSAIESAMLRVQRQYIKE